jgi:protein gp37
MDAGSAENALGFSTKSVSLPGKQKEPAVGENSKISWTTHTWNPYRGCQHATLPDGTEHPGCGHCYAEAMAKRNPQSLGVWGPNGTRVMAVKKTFNSPLKWEAQQQEKLDNYERWATAGFGSWEHPIPEDNRPRVFVDSMCDIFEDWQGPILNHKGQQLFTINGDEHFTEGEYPECRPLTMNDLRARVFSIIDQCPNIDFLLLTKRPENIRARRFWPPVQNQINPAYRSNVWLLYSASDQASWNAGKDSLKACRDLVPVLGCSAEPLIARIDYCEDFGIWWNQTTGQWVQDSKPWLDLIITGGESGPHARPHNIAWSRSIGEQCQAAGVAWWHKQMGSVCIAHGAERSIREVLLHGRPAPESVQLGPDWNLSNFPYHDTASDVFRIPFKDRFGSDPAEWGEGWLQAMPNTISR